MLEFLNNVDPLILDVAVIAILVLVAALGAIRGIQKVSINVILLSASLFLGFCSLTQGLKDTIADKFLSVEKIVSAGSTPTLKFAVSLVIPVALSLAIFLLFYIVLFVIRVLIGILVNKKKHSVKNKSIVGRVFASIISFIYAGAFMLAILISANTNIVGLKPAINKSTTTKFMMDKADILLDKIDVNFSDKLRLKIYSGDMTLQVQDKVLESFDYLDSKASIIISNKEYFEEISTALTEEEGSALVKERIMDLYHLSVVANSFKGETNEVAKQFRVFADDALVKIHANFTKSNLDKIEFEINELTNIKTSLKTIGVNETNLKYFEEITIGK